jgi:cullin 4
LQQALVAVYRKNASAISKEELYRAVESLCVQKYSQQTYENLSRNLEQFIVDKVHNLSEFIVDANLFLNKMELTWQDHCEQLSTIRNIFLYLDRSYACTFANTNASIKPIYELGHFIFRRELINFQQGLLLQKLILCLLTNITCMRHHDFSLAETTGNLIFMLVHLQCYHNHFEPVLLTESK